MESHLVLTPFALSALAFSVVNATCLISLLRSRPIRRGSFYRPAISILKPVAGVDDELEQNLESFAAIDYPCFELLLGLSDPEDPAWTILRSFRARHPDLALRIVQTNPNAALNPKVAQLIELTRLAKYPVLLVSDANVRVRPSYLSAMVATLDKPGTGMVSSLIIGTGERSFGAAIENAHLAAFIMPAVVASLAIGKVITVGKSMMMRRADLERIGDWDAVAQVLAEDELLGQRFRAFGFGVRLSLEPVENRNINCSCQRTLERHTRWAKLRRSINPLVFAVEPLLSPVLVAVATAIMFPGMSTLKAVIAAFVLQLVATFLLLLMLRREVPALSFLLVEIVRPWLAAYCWTGALLTRSVDWRGHRFTLERNSLLRPHKSNSLSKNAQLQSGGML